MSEFELLAQDLLTSYRPVGIERDHSGKYRLPSNQGVAKVTSGGHDRSDTLCSAKTRT
ncbi:TPA: hypothetical protein ACI4HA_005007 [Klebsiella pneumoniae]